MVAERGWVDAAELARLTGEPQTATVGSWVVDPAALAAAIEALQARVENAGGLGLDLASLDDRQRSLVDRLDGVVIEGGRIRPGAQADPLADHPYLAALRASPLAPPDPVGVDRAELHALYVELASFTAAYLAHQDVEERVVMPALEAAVGVPAVVEIHGRIVGGMPPEELARGLAVMLPAMNVDDRVEMLGGIRQSAPPEAFAGVWSLAGSVLPTADHQALAVRLGVHAAA